MMTQVNDKHFIVLIKNNNNRTNPIEEFNIEIKTMLQSLNLSMNENHKTHALIKEGARPVLTIDSLVGMLDKEDQKTYYTLSIKDTVSGKDFYREVHSKLVAETKTRNLRFDRNSIIEMLTSYNNFLNKNHQYSDFWESF